ncbi:MAG: YpdA family putative bacillithiol disulfide reductase [Acidobacteria bacterium]|nr:MAG: YpdA family putative bacillithiol disulfide reductase [Acidobacteriota bacterium]
MTLPLDLVIVGAGPSGLAAAIAAQQAGLGYEVLEKGALVNSIFHFPRHMTFFTTADLLEIGGLPFVTPFEKPTQAEGLKYYRKATEAYSLRVALGEEVTGVRALGESDGGARFVVQTRGKDGAGARRARNVVFATGYYDNPNLIGVPGEDLPHVSHYYTEAHPYFRKTVAVVGGKNSAAIAALELHRAGAEVTLVHRRPRLADSIKYWIRPDIENRIKEGSIAARFGTCVKEIRTSSVVVATAFETEELPADQVFLLTGYHPDTRMLAEAGVRVDEATLVPQHDPATLETSVPGLFLAGALVSGKQTSRIFIENGRFHGEAIVAAITSRALASARE